MTDKSEQRIFSYLRKSTKKEEQEASIDRQKVNVINIAKNLGINPNKIEYFTDNGKSGYKGSEYIDSKSETIVRKREGYSGMLAEIRKQKVPCKVLAWTVSRIARDSKEGGTIYNLLGNNTMKEKKIESIHFLDGTVWSAYTPQSEIYRKISNEEESSREKSVWKTERTNQALLLGLYPNELIAPKGLKNTGVGVKEGGIAGGKLKETEYMPFIKKAFEMKAEGASNSKIHGYLKRKGITVYIGKMYESIFSNTVYNGYYTDKKTGEVFDLKFVGGRKPITASLFKRANETISKKSGKYGDKQKFDLLANLLRTSEGRRLSVYTPKGKTAKQYQNATEKVYISQKKIFEHFEDVLNRIYFIQYQALIPAIFMLEEREEDIIKLKGKLKTNKEDKKLQTTIKEREKYLEIAKNKMEELLSISFEDFIVSDKKDYISKYSYVENPGHFMEIEGFAILQDLQPHLKGSNFFPEDYLESSMILENGNKKMNQILKSIVLKNGNQELKEQQQETNEDLELLEKEKKEIEDKIKNAIKNAILNGFSKEDMEEAVKELKTRVNEIDETMLELKNNSVTEQDLDKFVEALQDIFEHIRTLHNKGIERVSEEDMLHLIKLTTFELIKNPSEPLDIKLFEGLKKVFYGIGTPKGIRTPVSGVRGQRPNQLDDGSIK